jgi:hypothetical protein
MPRFRCLESAPRRPRRPRGMKRSLEFRTRALRWVLRWISRKRPPPWAPPRSLAHHPQNLVALPPAAFLCLGAPRRQGCARPREPSRPPEAPLRVCCQPRAQCLFLGAQHRVFVRVRARCRSREVQRRVLIRRRARFPCQEARHRVFVRLWARFRSREAQYRVFVRRWAQFLCQEVQHRVFVQRWARCRSREAQRRECIRLLRARGRGSEQQGVYRFLEPSAAVTISRSTSAPQPVSFRSRPRHTLL